MVEDALAAAKIKWAEEAGISDYLKEPELLVGEPVNVGSVSDNEK